MSMEYPHARQADPQRVAIYTRYSSELQLESSTTDQVRQCRAAAQRNGWTVMDQYVRSDEEVSGQLLADRHGLEDLMKLAQQKPRPFDGIVFDDTSRFGRGLSNALRLSEELEYAKVFLYFVNRQLDSRNPNFRTLFIQYAQQDEQSSFGTAEKVHRGQMGRVLRGYNSSCSP